MLSIRNFSKKYAERPILDIPALDLASGIYWIKGENGSGKSTLFKSVAGLIPYEGSISFSDGISWKRSPRQYLQRVTYSEAEPLYPGFLTGSELFAFVVKARGVSNSELSSIQKLLGVQEYMQQPVQTYSSGMSKKISLALSFLGDPKVIVLDEPFITLDPGSQCILSDYLKDLCLTKKPIIMISSHQVVDRDQLAPKVMILKDKTLKDEA
jgi:ABC-2 type transport system ATP-binding protein